MTNPDQPVDLDQPTSLRDLAATAARRAGDYLAQRVGDAGRIEHKGAIDLVTDADRQAEAIIIETIRETAPGHGILTEEGGQLGPRNAPVRWIIDPLDGTTNFAHAFPMFAVSVAAELRGAVVAGAVYAPMLDELFTAERGVGATLYRPRLAGGAVAADDAPAAVGQDLHVSSNAELGEAFLATGFPYDIRDNDNDNLDHFGRFAKRSLGIRRAGSAALDLAYVACGRFDGFWELRLKPWDVAAGALLVEEAGGRISMIDGGSFELESPALCASNGLIHDQMLEVLGASRFVGSRAR